MNEKVLDEVVNRYYDWVCDSCCACVDFCVARDKCEALREQGEEAYNCIQLIKDKITNS